jgi:hypothetical protein
MAPMKVWRAGSAAANGRFAAAAGSRHGGFGMSLRKADCVWGRQGRLRPAAVGRLFGQVSGKRSCWRVGARRVTERW